MTEISFVVRGLPVAQGSAKAFMAGGKAHVATDANRTNTPLGSWRGAIAAAASTAMGDEDVWTGPTTVTAWFIFPRPKSHYLPANAKRPVAELRLDAPRFVTAPPDLDKLARALLDGITNVVVRDDSQVGGLRCWKVYEDDEHRAGCQVLVTRLKGTR